MVWDKDFRVSVVEKHVATDGSAVLIEGVTQADISANITVKREVAANSIFAKVATVEAVKPVASFTTYNIAQAFGAGGLGLSGLCVTSDGSHPGITLYAQKQGCSGASAGSVHRKYTIATGILAPQSLTVDHRGDASIGYQIFAKYDGSTDPVVMTPSVALPTPSAAVDARWTMYSMSTFNAGEPVRTDSLEGKRNITLDFGAQVTSEGADSTVFDSVQSISQVLQTLTVRGVNPEWFVADASSAGVVDFDGRSLITDDYLVFTLRKQNTPLATAEHIKITVRGTLVVQTLLSGSPNSPAEASVEMHLIDDGTNAPVIVDTAFALA